MAFVEPITIRDAVESVHRKNYILPAIQREFVWDTYQIERLFDSLMRDYPISSFLFWSIDKSNIGNYQFYEFIQKYHERDFRHNPKANLSGQSDITAVLDGQQRLTSLYIGLKGTYAYKLPRKRWDNNLAFPVRKLYLNLLSASDNSDLEYNFKFLTKAESEKRDDNHFWFEVGYILNLKESVDVNDFLIENEISQLEKSKARFANKTIFKLFDVVHKNKSINFFLEKDESLDKVLNIFIRVNSGGTQLSYSDLLLSVATAQWKDKDAREEITEFVNDINAIGNGFNFNKDFVLKSCLVLSDFKNIAFKVDNFNQKNMLHIEKEWEAISSSIRTAVELLSSIGYHRDTLTSNNAVIPIAYYVKKIGCPYNFVEGGKYEKDRKMIFKWLIIALLKTTFGGQPDSVLRPIREIIAKSTEGFPFQGIIDKLKGTNKSMSLDDDEIYNIIYYNQYGQTYTYSILAFIYPSLDFRHNFHQDHIFPKKLFTRKKLEKIGIGQEKIDFFMENYNGIGNLQLLEGTPNQEKSGKDFKQWLNEKYPKRLEKLAYMERNHIPNVDLSIENFQEFIEKREELIFKFFKKMLS